MDRLLSPMVSYLHALFVLRAHFLLVSTLAVLTGAVPFTPAARKRSRHSASEPGACRHSRGGNRWSVERRRIDATIINMYYKAVADAKDRQPMVFQTEDDTGAWRSPRASHRACTQSPQSPSYLPLLLTPVTRQHISCVSFGAGGKNFQAELMDILMY